MKLFYLLEAQNLGLGEVIVLHLQALSCVDLIYRPHLVLLLRDILLAILCDPLDNLRRSSSKHQPFFVFRLASLAQKYPKVTNTIINLSLQNLNFGWITRKFYVQNSFTKIF